ncbi:hypothetical protein RIF29_29890 [Crotalaria pallida]|uniref:Uncharacterized protein n=1 Tax=Crotalaria pallida TaxID=3830 RepID=A0AAN9EFB6_CROPI
MFTSNSAPLAAEALRALEHWICSTLHFQVLPCASCTGIEQYKFGCLCSHLLQQRTECSILAMIETNVLDFFNNVFSVGCCVLFSP